MTMPSIQTRWVDLYNGDLAIAAYVAEPFAESSAESSAEPSAESFAESSTEPKPSAQFPGIIVIQEVFGVNAHIRDVTERIAREGYVAIAPAIYQRLAPGFEVGYESEDLKQGRIYKEQTRADQLLGDISGAIAWLQSHPQVKPEAIGCIGFCFGGHVAYLAATLPDIKVTASFYGAGITNWCPGGEGATIDRTAAIQGQLYGFFGLEDASIPVEQVDEIAVALQNHDVEHRLFRYPDAGHGFFCDRRSSYHATAATDAWQQVKALFQTL
jgi:carboxymethylenebutenolidase